MFDPLGRYLADLHMAHTPKGTRMWARDLRLLWKIVEALENEEDLKKALEEGKGEKGKANGA